jgi:radical SAM superfamily enzyme YgiQ (UPF0313 family)
MMTNRIKKILFVIPPYFEIKDYISKQLKLKAPIFALPTGVLSIAAYVKARSKNDVLVKVLDLNRETFKLCNTTQNIEGGIKNLIKEQMLHFKPDIVGISALFNTCYNYLESISTTCKNLKDDVLIIMGGGIATNLYNEILSHFPNIDALCFSEGEIPVNQLLDAENVCSYFKSSDAWITRDSLNEGRKPQSIFVQNLDEIPFFDYSLLDLNEYKGRTVDKVSGSKEVRQLSIYTSRGCPFNCVFCASGTVHGKKVRFMSIEKVISEIKKMVDLYNIDVLAIEDDHFLADKERAKVILRRLRDFKLRIEFPNGMAIYALDDEIGELLHKAGVTTVSLAMESGSDYVLKKIIDKPLRLDMVKNAVDILKKNEICVHCCIVLGLPGELEIHREETMQMILNTGFDWVYFNLAVPVVGSRLYKICKENGYLINNDFGEHNTSKCNIRTPEIDPEYMEEKAYLMNLEANFVRNHNLTIGDYNKSSLYFQNIVQTYPEHAFAHYYLAKSYEGLKKNDEIINHHRSKFIELINTNSTWRKYAKIFEVPLC